MAALPATAVGKATLVGRDALLALVDTVAQAEDPARALAGFRERKRTPPKRSLRSLVPHDTAPVEWDNLPSALTLTPGSVHIDFQNLETLCLCLVALADLLERQLDDFADRYEIRAAVPPAEGKAEVASLFAALEQGQADALEEATSR